MKLSLHNRINFRPLSCQPAPQKVSRYRRGLCLAYCRDNSVIRDYPTQLFSFSLYDLGLTN